MAEMVMFMSYIFYHNLNKNKQISFRDLHRDLQPVILPGHDTIIL